MHVRSNGLRSLLEVRRTCPGGLLRDDHLPLAGGTERITHLPLVERR
jgi:hypothetical protein